MAKHIIAPIPSEGKHIRFDRETKDYACYLDGEFIGYAPDHSAAETLVSNTYYEQLTHASAAVAEPEPDERPITVERLYRDGDDGDLVDEPRGELAYVDYCIGINRQGEHDDDRAWISFCVSDQPRATDYTEPMVSLCGSEGEPLDLIERAIANLQRLLADPRVIAARAAWEARQRQPMKKAA